MTGTPHPVSVDRAAGALLTMAMGDSLGFLVTGEGMTYAADFAKHSMAATDPPWLEKDDYGFGQYAIDTQLARELGRSIVESRGFEPTLFAARVGDLFRTARVVAAGRTTTRAGQRLAEGMVWAQAGEPAPAAGNGAAVRAAVMGLCFKSRRLRQGASRMQALITHHDQRAQAAAEVVAEAVFLAATRDVLPDRELLDTLADCADELDPRLASALRTLDRALSASHERAIAHIAPAGRVVAEGFPAQAAISGFSTPTVLFAIYAFLRAPDSPEDAIAIALSGGGDLASLGALTGALVGARKGWKALGPRLQGWAKHINDHGEHGPNDLIALAKGLVQRA